MHVHKKEKYGKPQFSSESKGNSQLSSAIDLNSPQTFTLQSSTYKQANCTNHDCTLRKSLVNNQLKSKRKVHFHHQMTLKLLIFYHHHESLSQK